MTARQALLAALALIEGAHFQPTNERRYMAVNGFGKRVRPGDPTAAAWSTIGALEKVAPAMIDYPAGWDAFGYLEDAAKAMGYRGTFEVDCEGRTRVIQMFWAAIDLHDAARTEVPA